MVILAWSSILLAASSCLITLMYLLYITQPIKFDDPVYSAKVLAGVVITGQVLIAAIQIWSIYNF